MKKRILLVADNARRDFIATRMLQRAFLKKGADARLSTLLDMVPNLRRFKPHGVMANRANMSFTKPASKCSRIYVFPAEGAYLTKESMLAVFKVEAYERIDSVEWVRRCYVWSDYVRNSLLETGMFRDDQLTVAGSPRLDVYRHHVRTREPFSISTKIFRFLGCLRAGILKICAGLIRQRCGFRCDI